MQFQIIGYQGRIRDEDMDTAAAIGEAGREGRRAEIPSLITFIQRPSHLAYVINGLHALAQLGATESLPDFDDYIDDNPDTYVGNFAQAEKARLLAESDARGHPNGPAQAAAKVRRFLAELNLTPATLNQSPLSYTRMKTVHDLAGNYRTYPSEPITSVAAYALHALADMVYHGTYADFASLSEIAAINFARDPRSALKMRLAPLPHAMRLSTMIEELAHKEVLRSEDNLEIQLLINEGLPGGRAVAAKIEDMDAHREQYSRQGFSALFDVLGGLGDKTHLPLAERFWKRRDGNVGPIYGAIYAGVRREKVAAY